MKHVLIVGILLIYPFLMGCVGNKIDLKMRGTLDYFKKGNPQAMGDLKELKLYDYTYMGKIETEQEKEEVIAAMYADDASISSVSMITVSDTCITKTDSIIDQKMFPEFEIITIAQAVKKGQLSKDSIFTVKQQLQKNIPIGTDYLKLTWEYKGNKYQTMALYEDQTGLCDLVLVELITGGRTITKSIQKPSD